MSILSIHGSNGRINVRVFDYERNADPGSSDANWLRCHVAIEVDPFKAEYDANFATQDFHRFRDGLDKLLNSLVGKATFSSDEPWLFFEIEIASGGGASVSGDAASLARPKSALHFVFNTDQSYLRTSLNEVNAILKKFPTR